MSDELCAVFLDRDDTIIRNIPYLGDPDQVELLPNARLSLRALTNAGFVLVIVSNQSGVGRGLITEEQVAAVNEEMFRQLGESIQFKDVLNCYAAPDQPGGECRKPSPAMLLEAAGRHHINLSRSYFVGDRLSDVQAGKAAGCRSVLVLTGRCDSEEAAVQAQAVADFVAPGLNEAAEWILAPC